MEDIIDIIVTETTNLIEITSQPTDEIIDVNIIDNREDVTLNVTPTVVEININSLTGNFGVNWGEIDGTLSNQTDLQNALNLKADLVDGKVPSSQLPSYVDDVVEVANYASLPVTGEAGKIYVTIDTNFIYRWTGSVYVEIKDSSAVWGAITGTLSSQTDLQNALNAKEPTITAGTTAQYYRGDKTFQTLNTTAVTEATNLYYTDARARASISGGTGISYNSTNGVITNTITQYTDALARAAISLTVSGSSGASTYNSTTGVLNVPTYTLAGLGGQPALSGTGFVKISGSTISYDNSTYLTTTSASSTYVPYTGANASVNLGNNNIEINGTTAYVRVQGGGASGFISESAGAKMQLSPTSLFLTEKQSSPNYTKTLDFRPTILGANYTIVVPDASGTIALTSQLHNAVTIGTANGLSLSTQVLSLGLASSTANGALSSTDWTTFNNKQNALTNPVTGTGTSGIVAVFNGTSSITDSTIYANSTRVSIGADITTTNRFTAVSSTSSAYAVVAQASSAAHGIWSNVLGTGEIFRGQTAGGSYFIINNGGNAFLNGNLNVGDFASTSYRLNVVGTANITGALSGTSATFSGLTVDNNQNGSTWVIAKNQNVGSGAAAGFLMTNNTGDLGAISLLSSGNSPANGLFIRTLSTNSLILGTNSTANLTIASGGAATFSSSVTATNLYTSYTAAYSAEFYRNNAADSRINLTNTTTTSGADKGLMLGEIGVDSYFYNYAAGAAIFGTSSTERMRITSSGNVGIGTTSPLSPLHLVGSTTGAVQLYIHNVNGATNSSAELVFGTWGGAIPTGSSNPGPSAKIVALNTLNTDARTDLAFHTYASTGTSAERMRITSGGNIGIGTTSPSYLLHVKGSGFYNGTILADNTGTTGGGSFQIAVNGVVKGAFSTVGLFQGNTDANLSIQSVNGISIFTNSATTSPALYIRTDKSVELTSLGTGLVYSNAGVLTSTNPSDSRLKKNIKTISYGLSDIMKLRPVSYDWKEDNINQGIQFGFIAQEVQEVMPDAIKEFGEETKFLGLEKDAIYATLVNAVKELKAELDTLKNK